MQRKYTADTSVFGDSLSVSLRKTGDAGRTTQENKQNRHDQITDIDRNNALIETTH